MMGPGIDTHPGVPGWVEGDPSILPGESPPAFAQIKSLLERYGLGSLAQWAWDLAKNGATAAEIENSLWERTEFRERFAGIFAREENGLPPISVDEYLAYEQQASQLARTYGVPEQFIGQQGYATLIGQNVSVVELEQRLGLYSEAVEVGRDALRVELARQNQGLGVDAIVDEMTTGELIAFFGSPDNDLSAVRSRLQSAQVSAAGVLSGFGALSAQESDMLRAAGVDPDQAGQALGELARSREVTGALAGESGGMSRERVLAAAGGDADAQAELERRRRGRQGVFEGGGGFATGQEGVGGLGSAST